MTMGQRLGNSLPLMPLGQAAQPLYHRVYRQIAEEIDGGELRPGDRLPSERWLCDALGVSRATVRRALEELVADGLVEARGRGSFVTGEALAEPPNALMSLSELGRSRGLEASARVLARRCAPGHARRGRGVRDRARRRAVRAPRACGCSTACRSRSTRTACRCAIAPAAAELDFTTASLYETLEARRAAARARRLRGRGPGRRSARRRAARADARGARPVRHHRGDRRGRPRRRHRPHGLPCRSLPIPRDADAPPPGRGRAQMRTRWLRAVAGAAAVIVIAGCGGTPGEDKPKESEESSSAAVKTDGFESLGDVTLRVVSSEGSGGPREAIRELNARVREEVPERHGRRHLPRLRELDQAGQALPGRRQPARRGRPATRATRSTASS